MSDGARRQEHGQGYRGAHVPRTLTQVLNEANEAIVQGDLSNFIPIPSGFDPLDAAIGGGLQRGELILLGGPQGIGKTITALQMARNIAKNQGMYSFFLSYEHSETHLFNRLLCLESITPPNIDANRGVRMKDLQDIIVARSAQQRLRQDGTGSLRGILRENERTSPALARISEYSDRLILLKASPAVTTLSTIRDMVSKLVKGTNGNVVIFVDYLQKIAIHPETAQDENDKVTIIVEGLKDIALSYGVPVFAVVAAEREGLKANRLHLFHLRGSSALDYECDIAIIMNNKYKILSKEHVSFNPYHARQYREWVVFTIEKNRAGRAFVDVEFRLHAPFFAFDPVGQLVQQQLIDEKIFEN